MTSEMLDWVTYLKIDIGEALAGMARGIWYTPRRAIEGAVRSNVDCNLPMHRVMGRNAG